MVPTGNWSVSAESTALSQKGKKKALNDLISDKEACSAGPETTTPKALGKQVERHLNNQPLGLFFPLKHYLRSVKRIHFMCVV